MDKVFGRDAIVLNDPRPKLRCAAKGCESWTYRDVRLADSLPAPADAGWYEVELPGTRRTVLFACSARCASALAGIHVADDLHAFSEQPVLPD